MITADRTGEYTITYDRDWYTTTARDWEIKYSTVASTYSNYYITYPSKVSAFKLYNSNSTITNEYLSGSWETLKYTSTNPYIWHTDSAYIDSEGQTVYIKGISRPFTAEELAAQRAGRIREIIASRMAPHIMVRRPITPTQDVTEARARETLRRCLGEVKFRQFIKNGFVTVKAASGKVYKIFPGHEMTIVYENGQPIEKLCVVLQGQFPPTDVLIMRYLLLLNNEEFFRQKAIKHPLRQPEERVVDQRPLPEIMADLKLRLVA